MTLTLAILAVVLLLFAALELHVRTRGGKLKRFAAEWRRRRR